MDEYESDDSEDIASGEEFLFGFKLDSLEGSSPQDDDDDDGDSSSDDGYDLGKNGCNDSSASYSLVKSLCEFQEDYESDKILATPSDFAKLFQWACNEGAMLDGMTCRADYHGGRGLYATKNLASTEVIAMLPRSLRWGQAHAYRRLNLPPSTPDLTALTLLVISLCRERHIYAKCLPRQGQFTNALFLSKKEEEWWGNLDEGYSEAIRRFRSTAEGCQSYIRHFLLQEESLAGEDDNDNIALSPIVMWAIAMVKSRSHAFGSKRGYWLTPVLDLLNHSPSPNAVLVSGDEGQILLQAKSLISEGSELTIDYQVDDDTMLLATYGFSLFHRHPLSM